MMQWYFLASQLDQTVSKMVVLLVRVVIERTPAYEIARMSAIFASLDSSKSESEEDETTEMHFSK